jgi:oligogalacturonide lyase
MVFYSTDSTHGRQLYTVDLSTRKIEQLTHQGSPMIFTRSKTVYL